MCSGWIPSACCVGIVITVKQRQEFRIILLKRARRVAERKLEMYDEERLARNVSLSRLYIRNCNLFYYSKIMPHRSKDANALEHQYVDFHLGSC